MTERAPPQHAGAGGGRAAQAAEENGRVVISKEVIEAFLEQMRSRHEGEIRAVELPEGTEAYIAERAAAGDSETLTFMLKLAYLMGLHTGFAAQVGETPPSTPRGPLQA